MPFFIEKNTSLWPSKAHVCFNLLIDDFVAGIYLTVTMAMTSLSVIFAVFVLHVHHRGSLNRRAPLWLRKSALRMAKVVCSTPSPYLLATYKEVREEQEDPESTQRLRPGKRRPW